MLFLRHGRRAGRYAFTLVELLVVIGIIALLIGILLPALGRAREQSNRVACSANLRSLGQCMVLYADAYAGRLPNGNFPGSADPAKGDQVLATFANDIVSTAAAFRCPADVDPAPRLITNNYLQTSGSARVSYDFFSIYWLPERGPMLVRLRGQAPLAWDLDVGTTQSAMQNHGPGGGNVLYADGHVAWQPAAEWDARDWPHPAADFYASIDQ